VTKIYLQPSFEGPDAGEGGIRRVVEAQRKYLPEFGIIPTNNLGEADLISTHGALLFPEIRLPKIHHWHGCYWSEYSWPRWALHANRYVYDCIRLSDAITAPSEWTARILRRHLWINPAVIFHGVEPDEFEIGTPQDYVLWNKTRVDPVCDPASVNKLAAMAGDVQFKTTFGNKSYNVDVLGLVPYDQALDLVRNAGVYLATTRETFGIGVLEALAYGVPCLGWNFGGLPEIITHKKHGWLAEPGDYNSLFEGLRYCLENRAKLSKAARAHAIKNFAWRDKIKLYADVYNNVLREHRTKRPKVSVVVRSYNDAKLLPRAVASIDLEDSEIVIVNDASTDETAEVATALSSKDSRVRVVTNNVRLGVSGALNSGSSAARGHYILNLDADNELVPGSLRLLSDALDNNQRLDIAYGAMQVIDGQENYVSNWPPREFSYTAQISHKNQIHSSAMWRRKWWERACGYRRRCKTAEDADFWCRITSLGAMPGRITDAPTLIYHVRQDGVSNTTPDWNWHDWYSWHRREFSHLMPIAVSPERVSTFEPARITVVIPCGPGHSDFLLDAIDSLVAQSFTAWDCIVVNDSGKPLGRLPSFVYVIDSPAPASGPAVARNIGINASKTELFVTLDADDYLQPEALEALYKNYEPGYFVYSDYVIDERNEVRTTSEFNCEDLLHISPYPVTCLYEKSAWAKVGGFDESIKSYEDWDFFIALAAQGVCGKRVAMPLLHYRVSTGMRRETMYETIESNKREISAKWYKFMSGEEKLPCGGCGSRRDTPGYRSVLNATSTPVVPKLEGGSSEAVMIEYVGGDAPRTFRSNVTGAEYRFGNTTSHKIKYVLVQDVNIFLNREGFVQRDGNEVKQTELLKA